MARAQAWLEGGRSALQEAVAVEDSRDPPAGGAGGARGARADVQLSNPLMGWGPHQGAVNEGRTPDCLWGERAASSVTVTDVWVASPSRGVRGVRRRGADCGDWKEGASKTLCA